MLIKRTLFFTLLLSASLYTYAASDTPAVKEQPTFSLALQQPATQYTFLLDNTINNNTMVDSVLVILDKYDRSGAGIVKKIFYPNPANQVVVDNLPTGKYYADVYVLGLYKNHFTSVITVKRKKRNKVTLRLHFKDVYTPGNAKIPAENLALFAFNKR